MRCQLSMYYSLASSFRNPPIIFRKSVSSYSLVSVLITRFFKKDVGSFLTFPVKNLEVIIDFPYLAWFLTIHLAIYRSLFAAGSLASAGTSIFHRSLGHQTSFFSDFSLLLQLSSSPLLEPFFKNEFLDLSLRWFPIFLFFLLFFLDGFSRKIRLEEDKF